MKILAATAIVLGLAPAIAGATAAPSDQRPGASFAHWGMTPEQVRAASHGMVVVDQPGRDDWKGEYSIGRFRFHVSVDYAPDREHPDEGQDETLRLVNLTMALDRTSGTCAALAAYLPTVFGAPAHRTTAGPVNLEWRWKAQDDSLRYYSWPDKKCGVQYGPYAAE
jgi:hypothetical protein